MCRVSEGDLAGYSLANTPPGTLFRASQFLSEELPIRLAHRVQDLGELPDGLSEMPSIKKVQDWYAQSFEVRLLGIAPGFPLCKYRMRIA